VALSAPTTLGPCRATWQAQTAEGAPFGDILHTAIEVVRPGAIDDARYESYVDYPDGAVVTAGTRFRKTWRVRNAGTSVWSAGYALVFVADNRMNAPDSIPLPGALPGESVEVAVPLEAPLAPGLHPAHGGPETEGRSSAMRSTPNCAYLSRPPADRRPSTTQWRAHRRARWQRGAGAHLPQDVGHSQYRLDDPGRRL
jgi:hypothetical protein